MGLISMDKAQVSVEFIAVTAVALTILLVFVSGYYAKIGSLGTQRINSRASYLSTKASNSINDVLMAGSGSSRVIYLPEQLLSNEDYDVVIYPSSRSVYVNWSTGEAGEKFLTSNVTGQFTKGRNEVTNDGEEIIIG